MPWPLYLAALLWAAGYLAACRWWPYTRCRRCDGGGRRGQPGAKRTAWRLCPRCHGNGRRLRLGRRLINSLSSDARTATANEGTTR